MKAIVTLSKLAHWYRVKNVHADLTDVNMRAGERATCLKTGQRENTGGTDVKKKQ